MTPAEIGTHIRSLRARKGVSLRELGRLADMAPASISAIENGGSSPTLATLHKMLRVLGTDFTEFFSASLVAPREPVFTASGMKVITDGSRRYVIPFPKRDDIRFEAILETLRPTKKESEWETLDCDMAGIVLQGGPLKLEIRDQGEWKVRTGDAFFVPEGATHRATNMSRATVKIVTIYYPPRY
jgi:transcriptional regulator with XRE-family HTH domain